MIRKTDIDQHQMVARMIDQIVEARNRLGLAAAVDDQPSEAPTGSCHRASSSRPGSRPEPKPVDGAAGYLVYAGVHGWQEMTSEQKLGS